MSSLLRPVGHLPASVYWFRRGLVLAVVVVLLVLVLRLFGGGSADPQNAAATDPGQGPTSAPPVSPSTRPTSTWTPTQTTPAKTTPPANLTCDGPDIRITALPANRKIVSGSVLNFVVSLEAVNDGCKAIIDGDKLTVSVLSGTDLIWTTTHCAQSIQRATLTVAKGKQVASTVAWNGHRSGPGCLPGQPVAKPGTYIVTANYQGRSSTPQAFQIV